MQTKEPGAVRGEMRTDVHSQSSRTQMFTDDRPAMKVGGASRGLERDWECS